MYLYLVDHSSERGQRKVLTEERYISYLQSYAFVGQAGFIDTQKYWEELLRIHLADTTAKLNGDVNIKEVLVDENKPEHLFSYAYQNHESQWSDSKNQTIEKNKNMNIHLAGHSVNVDMDKVVKPLHENHLTTFADQKEVKDTLANYYINNDTGLKEIADEMVNGDVVDLLKTSQLPYNQLNDLYKSTRESFVRSLSDELPEIQENLLKRFDNTVKPY